MTRFHWFLPTSGDGFEVGAATVAAGAARHTRPGSVGYLSQVARAAEQAGFDSVLTPVGAGCPDPWIICSAVAQHTTRLRFLVAFRTGFTLPTLLAQQAEAFQTVSGGRLSLNVVTGGDAALGLDEFILSGWPHLEEAYRVGERVLPKTRAH